ncbi:hypothetical protein ABIA00_004192 [Bradyrhizobium ottawaense]
MDSGTGAAGTNFCENNPMHSRQVIEFAKPSRSQKLCSSFRGAPLGASPESIVQRRLSHDGFRVRDCVAPRNDGRERG